MRRRRRFSAYGAALVGAVASLVVPGCGGAGTTRAPAIQVVTGVYPVAQAVQRVGGSAVSVIDVVPPGADPRTYRLTASQVAEVRRAALVILAGPGFQPSLDTAAKAARRVLDLQASLSTGAPYVWLDPGLMVSAVATTATAMEAANPAGASIYRDGARAFASEVTSTGIDYQSTLSTCPRRTIVTPDGAFAEMASRYDLTDQVVDGTEPVAAAAASARSAGVTTVFSEPFVAPARVDAVASAAHLRERVLDPLTGPPPTGWPRQADYIRLMEANLGALSQALACPETNSGT
jgi:ABC-type Zn uptake system ZnuABC Zn-binding protein ZnuA